MDWAFRLEGDEKFIIYFFYYIVQLIRTRTWRSVLPGRRFPTRSRRRCWTYLRIHLYGIPSHSLITLRPTAGSPVRRRSWSRTEHLCGKLGSRRCPTGRRRSPRVWRAIHKRWFVGGWQIFLFIEIILECTPWWSFTSCCRDWLDGVRSVREG